MIRKVNQENMQVIYLFGLKILCDGYVITNIIVKAKSLILSIFLCDGYVIKGVN